MIEALENSFGKGYYADKVVERILKQNRKWGARDRGFIAESTYEIVRWWRYLWELFGKEPNLKRKELYKIFGLWWRLQGNELPEWGQFSDIRNFDIKRAQSELEDSPAITQSYPDWLHQLALEELGSQWNEIATNLNLPAEVCLRANTLKTNRDELANVLLEENVETERSQLSEVGLLLKKRKNTFRNPSFQNGLFEVQDVGSQLISPFLDVKPGMRVIDACAGAGGKALHLAALMENKGSLIAMDVEGWKLEELKKRARRNGVHNIETRAIESSKTIKRLSGSADRLLLDVPCSGTGVIKRNPDTKWKLQPEHLDRVRMIQRNILDDYTQMVRPGGVLVYATCSILKSENEDQVARFLEENPEFKLLEQVRTNPSKETDGFFMAKIQREG